MDVVRGKDNFISTYDFLINQLLAYDYNDDESLKKLKMKISALDAEITQEESLGLEIVANKAYYPGQYMILTNDNGPKLMSCNTYHYSGIIGSVPLPTPSVFKIKTQYYGDVVINTEIFNGNNNNYLPVSYTKYGDMIIYQEQLYRAASDFISGTEFIITDWIQMLVREFEANTSYAVNDIILYKNSYYFVVSAFTSGDALIVKPVYFPSFWDEVGAAPLWETNIAVPVNHYDSILNELELLKEYKAAVDAGDMAAWEDIKTNRQQNVTNWVDTVNKLTGFKNKDYNLAYTKRPSLMTDIQFEEIRTEYESKITSNELGNIDDIMSKPGSVDSTSKNAKNETSALSSSSPPALIEPGLRKNGVTELNEEEPRERYSDDTYDELHDLVYAVLCPDATTRTDLRFSKGWLPNHSYQQYDFIDTFQEDAIDIDNFPSHNLNINNVDNSDLWDTWGSFGNEGHIWICRTPHNSSNIYPEFNVGRLSDLPTTSETNDPQIKIWIDPNLTSPTYQETLWVRPMWGAVNKDYIENPEPTVYPDIQWYTDIVYNSEADSDAASVASNGFSIPGSIAVGIGTVTEIIPQEHAFYEYGILPLVFYHHNAIDNDTPELKNQEWVACNAEDIGGILTTQFTYKVTDPNSIGSDGLPLDCVLVQWEDMVFRVIEEFSTIECPAMPAVVTSQILNHLSKLSYVGNVKCIKSRYRTDLGGNWMRGDDPISTRWWGLAFASQRNYIGNQNPCCCGNVPSGLDPEPIPLLRRLHDLVLCSTCGFEYDAWGGTTCPICGGTASLSRYQANTPPNPERGRIIIAQSCGRAEFLYNAVVSQAQYGQACYEYGLSPTNGCFHTIASGVSDCMSCYGIWKLVPEQHNTPINDLSFTYKKRRYINLIHTGVVAGIEWPCVAGVLDPVHGPTSIGNYYGTPEECFEAVAIVRYIAGAVEIVKTPFDLPSGTSNPGDLTFERFVVLNRRLRVNRQLINNKIIAIGDKQIGTILKCVTVPNLKPDFIQKIEDQKNQKFNISEYLRETTPEWN